MILPMVDFMGEPSGPFMAFNITVAWDAEIGSMWPIVIQKRLAYTPIVEKPGRTGLKPTDGLNCFVACFTHTLDIESFVTSMAGLLWNEGLHKPGTFVTEKVPHKDGNPDYVRIDSLIERIANGEAPALMITKNQTQGVILADTVYTLSKGMTKRGLFARDVRRQPGDYGQQVEIFAQEIAADGEFLTYV
jgi:hypothetical protein